MKLISGWVTPMHNVIFMPRPVRHKIEQLLLTVTPLALVELDVDK